MLNPASTVSPHLLELYDSVSIGKQALLDTLARLFCALKVNILESPQQKINADNSTICTLPSVSPERKSEHRFLVLDQKALLLFQSDAYVSVYLSLDFSSAEEAKQQCCSPQALSLIPHVQQALCMNYRLHQQNSDLASIHHVLDHSPIPALAIDNHFKTIFVNRSALKILSTEHQTNYQTERLLSDKQPASLLQLCEQEAHKKQLKCYLTESLTHISTESRYLAVDINNQNLALIIAPQDNVPNVFRQFSRDSIAWVYLLSPEYAQTLKTHPNFQQLGLSSTETELACLLFEGLSLNTIADKRHVSKQTVRKQLQSILKKTACENQEELMIFFFEKYIHYGLTH